MNRNKFTFNRIGLLGLLGLLALVWPIAGHWPFIFTLGYCTFFRYLRVIPDELFKENIKSSAATGFFVTQILIALTFFSWAILSEALQLFDAFQILFWGNLLSVYLGFIVFALKLNKLDRGEKEDIKNVV